MTTFFVLVMTFPNGNKVTKHYIASSKEKAINQARNEYPYASTINLSHEWSE